MALVVESGLKRLEARVKLVPSQDVIESDVGVCVTVGPKLRSKYELGGQGQGWGSF